MSPKQQKQNQTSPFNPFIYIYREADVETNYNKILAFYHAEMKMPQWEKLYD